MFLILNSGAKVHANQWLESTVKNHIKSHKIIWPSFFLFVLVIVWLFSFLSSDLCAASLCMGPMPGQDEESLAMPIMSDSDLYIPPTADVEIQISNKGMKISVEKGGVIKGLEENKKHLVKVVYDGKIFQSFWMDFKEHGTSDLCLWYYQGYGTLSLLNSREMRCNCDNTL